MIPLTEVALAAVFTWSALVSGTTPAADIGVSGRRTTVTGLGVADSLATATAPTLPVPRLRLVLPSDTVPKRRAKAVVYSDAYATRLTIHRRLSWGMIPLFAASYFSGRELLKAADEGRDAPSWARSVHAPAASGSAILFGANTITGAWNLWEGRTDANGRVRRVAHAVMFMVASGGFVYAGTMLAEDAGESPSHARRHRNVALGSIGISTASWLVMLIGN